MMLFASLFAGLCIAAPIGYFYSHTSAWTLKQMLLFLAVAILVVAWILHFISWKSERLVAKDNEHDA